MLPKGQTIVCIICPFFTLLFYNSNKNAALELLKEKLQDSYDPLEGLIKPNAKRYSLVEDLTILVATDDTRFKVGVVKSYFFQALGHLFQRTAQGVESRYRKIISERREQLYKLCERENIKPLPLDTAFAEYDQRVKNPGSFAKSKTKPKPKPKPTIQKKRTVPDFEPVEQSKFSASDDAKLVGWVRLFPFDEEDADIIYQTFCKDIGHGTPNEWKSRFQALNKNYLLWKGGAAQLTTAKHVLHVFGKTSYFSPEGITIKDLAEKIAASSNANSNAKARTPSPEIIRTGAGASSSEEIASSDGGVSSSGSSNGYESANESMPFNPAKFPPSLVSFGSRVQPFPSLS